MLQAVPVTETKADYARIEALYERSFPENERRSLRPLLTDRTGYSDFLAFYDADVFVGFACLLSLGDITHILYIAIDEPMRGKGFGAEALRAVERIRPGQRVLADLEDDRCEADANGPRRRRKRFYLGCGYECTDITYRWRDEDYVILSRGGMVSPEEFWAFWHYFECENTAFSEF